MNVLLNHVNNITNPNSHITDIGTLGGGGTEDPTDDPEWLKTLVFDEKSYESNGDDHIDWIKDDQGNIIGGVWTGTAWMYYIGSPAAPDPNYSGSHGSAYPDLRLDEFTASNLPAAGAFTLGWEKSSYSFSVNTAKENGELVHRITRK
jgi:hypothetical protein